LLSVTRRSPNALNRRALGDVRVHGQLHEAGHDVVDRGVEVTIHLRVAQDRSQDTGRDTGEPLGGAGGSQGEAVSEPEANHTFAVSSDIPMSVNRRPIGPMSDKVPFTSNTTELGVFIAPLPHRLVSFSL
jgi:hypothetical protein